MRKEVKFWTNCLDFGMITGIILIAYSTALMMTEQNQGGLQYLSYAILITGMVLGTLRLRNKGMGGYISYGRALGSCYVITLIAAILSIIFFVVYITSIDPGMIDKMLLQAEENMHNQPGMNDEQIEIAMEWTRKFMTPSMMAIFGLLGYAIMGIIISLITAAFLFKNNPNPLEGTPLDQEMK